MTDRIFKNWNLFRALRLGIGLFFLTDGILSGIWPMMAFGLFFTVLPLFNLGCCGTANCASTINPNTDSEEEDVVFEEIK